MDTKHIVVPFYVPKNMFQKIWFQQKAFHLFMTGTRPIFGFQPTRGSWFWFPRSSRTKNLVTEKVDQPIGLQPISPGLVDPRESHLGLEHWHLKSCHLNVFVAGV